MILPSCFISPVASHSGARRSLWNYNNSPVTCSRRPYRSPAIFSCIPEPNPQYLESNQSFISLSGSNLNSHPKTNLSLESPPDDATVSTSYDSNIGGGSENNDNNGGTGGNSDDFYNDDDSLPEDMQKALVYGSLTREAINRFKVAKLNPFLKFFLAIPAFRSRFLMDSSFLFKLLVQEIVGNGTSLAGEIVVRGSDIFHELEYVASDLIIGTVIEAAFVWLLAPTLPLPSLPNASFLSKYFNNLPSNIFQPSTSLQYFSLSQRFVSFFYSALQYAGIGFVGGVVGTAITYGLLESRKLLDKEYKPLRPMPAVLPNSLGWAAFMAGSCNTRFQLVEGLEMGVAKLLASRSEKLVNTAIVTLRFINNYYGGVQFVQFFRAIGLHATGDEHSQEEDKKHEINSDLKIRDQSAD